MKKALILATVFLTAPAAALAQGFGFSFSSGKGGTSFSLGVGDSGAAASSGGWNAGMLSMTGLPSGSIMGILINLMFWLLGLLGIFGVIGFVISGILYLVSTGDDEMLKRAKKSMTWSFVGVIVGLLGVVVIQAISFMLSGVSGF